MPDEKLPIPQFAAKIKAKYPEYKDVNDTLLVQKIVAKYPEYRESVDLSGIEEPSKKKVSSLLSGVGGVALQNGSQGGSSLLNGGGGGVKKVEYPDTLPENEWDRKRAEREKYFSESINQEEYKKDPLKTLNKAVFSEAIGKEINKKPISESTGQKYLSPEIKVNEENINVYNQRRLEDNLKENIFPTTQAARDWKFANGKGGVTDADNETDLLADKVINEHEKVKAILNLHRGDIKNAAIEYYANQDPRVAEIFKAGGTPPPETVGALVGNFLRDKNVLELTQESKEFNDAYREAQFNFRRDYPEMFTNEIVQKIAQGREDYGENNPFINLVGVNSSDRVIQRLYDEKKIDEEELEHYQKVVRPQLALHLKRIPTTGFVENAFQSAEKGLTDIPKGLYDLTGIHNAITTKADRAYDELSEEANYTHVTPKTFGGTIATATGHLGGLLLPLSAGTKALAASKIMNAKTANEVMMGLTFYHDLYKDAEKNNPNGGYLNQLQALVQTTIFAKINPTFGALSKGVVTKAAPQIKEVLEKLKTESITGSQAKEGIVQAILTQVPKKTLKTSGEMMLATGVSDAVGGIFSGKYDGEQSINNMVHTFESMLLGTPLLNLASVRSNRRVMEEYLSDMGDNPTRYREQITKLAETDPEIKKRLPELLQNLTHVEAVKKELDAREDIKPSEKKKYLLLSLQEKLLKEKADAIPDEGLKPEKQLKEIEIEKKMALDPDMGNQKIVEEFYNIEGLLPKGISERLEVDGKFSPAKVGGILKEIAQQANNLDENWKPISGEVKMTKPNVPDQLIEIANERWVKEIEKALPKEEPISDLGFNEETGEPTSEAKAEQPSTGLSRGDENDVSGFRASKESEANDLINKIKKLRNEDGSVSEENAAEFRKLRDELNALKVQALDKTTFHELVDKANNGDKEAQDFLDDNKIKWKEKTSVETPVGSKNNSEDANIENVSDTKNTQSTKENKGKQEQDYVDKNPNVALNTEFLGKGIGTAIIKKPDGYYYHVNKVETKIPNQKRAEKAFNESKQSEKEIILSKDPSLSSNTPSKPEATASKVAEQGVLAGSGKGVTSGQTSKDANDILTGKKVFERFSQDEQHGLTEGGKNHVEASLLLAASEGTGGKNNATPEAQENRIEAHAKENGIWTDNTTEHFTEKFGEPIGAGEEAIVWYDKNNGKVVKTQDTFQYENLQQKLDGITLHNAYFPEAPIKVLGFGRNSKGEFQVIVEQPFIQGEKLTPAEIKTHLEKVGFKENENGHFSNGETIIEDVHTGNAIKTPEGNIVVIDPIMRLNTPEQGYGGTRKLKNTTQDIDNKPPEPPKPPEKETVGNNGEGDGLSGIKKGLVSDEIIKGVDLERVGDKQMIELGRKIIDSGEVKPEALVQKIITEKTGVLKPSEVVALITYKADIDNGLRDAYKKANEKTEAGEDLGTLGVEIKDLERQQHDFDVMAVITANQQSMAFRLRRMMLDRDYNVVTQIERYKRNNNGEIPVDIQAKFEQLGKELKEVRDKLAEAEKALADKEGQEAVDNIKESVEREKRYTDEELEKKVQEGVESEISKLYEQLPSEKRGAADRAIAALEKFRKKLKGDGSKAYSSLAAIPVAIADTGALVAIRAIKVGKSVVEAVRIGINRMKDDMRKKGIEVKDWEESYTKALTEALEVEGVSLRPVKDKPTINEDGTVSIPNKMLRDLVQSGITDINDLTDAVHKEVVKDLPDVTTRQVRDYITNYGKEVNPTSDEVQTQINTAKRVGRLLSELEDLQKMNKAEFLLKYQKPKPDKSKITEAERELKQKIKTLGGEFIGDVATETKEARTNSQRLEDAKKKVNESIEKIRTEIITKERELKEKQKPLNEDLELARLKESEGALKNLRDKYLPEPKDAFENEKARERVKDRLVDEIIDLNEQINAGEKKAKDTTLKFADDAQLNKLREIKKAKQEVLDILDPRAKEEVRIKSAIKAAEKSLAEYERRIREKDTSPKAKEDKPTTPELDAIREKRDDAKKEYEEFKKTVPKTEAQILSESKQRAATRIKQLETKIRNKDFAKPVKKLKPTDTELTDLVAKKEKLQEEFDNEQYKLELKNRNGWQKAEDVALEATSGLIRGLVASLDVSATFVQGMYRLMIDLGKSTWQLARLKKPSPNRSLIAVKDMFRSLVSQKYADNYLAGVKSSEKYPLIKASKLAIDDKAGHISAKEGFFISNWINLIWNHVLAPTVAMPVSIFTKGNVRRAYDIAKAINPYLASQRAFDGYVNSIRVSSYKDFAKSLENDGYTFEADPKVFQKAADVINTTTGRGSLGAADASSRWLNIFLFAPRKVVSEVKLFTPYAFAYYAKMPKPVRNKALKDLGIFLASFTTANALMWASNKPDDDDEEGMKIWRDFWNMNSSNFLTHKIGDKRVSIGGGAKSMIVFQSRLFTGKFTDQNGNTTELGDRFGKQINTRFDLITNFIAGKSSPVISVAIKKAQERKGLEVDDAELIRDVTVPIWMQDLKEMYKNDPTTVNAILTAFSIFGANVRTPDQSQKSQGNTLTKEEKEDPTFKYFIDKGINFPELDPKKIETKSVNGKPTEHLSDLPKETQEKYLEIKKRYLKEELEKLKNGEYEIYRDKNGTVRFTDDGDSEYVEFKDLTKEDINYLLGSSLSGKITEKTKKEVLEEQ